MRWQDPGILEPVLVFFKKLLQSIEAGIRYASKNCNYR